MRYDPIADFAYHLGYSYGEAEEMLTTHEKKSNEKEFKKKVKVEKRTDTKDNKNVFKNWILEEARLDYEELTLYYKGIYKEKKYEGYIVNLEKIGFPIFNITIKKYKEEILAKVIDEIIKKPTPGATRDAVPPGHGRTTKRSAPGRTRCRPPWA